LPAQGMDRPQKGEYAGRRVLIAEDHKMMREGLRSLLEEKLGDVSVEEASSGYEAVRKAREFEPEIVIMDIGLPDLNGVEATRQIKAHQPQIEVVVLSMHASRNYVLQMLQAGASAYLLKDSAFEDLAAAVAAVSKGGMYLSAAITTAAALKNDATGVSTRTLVDTQRLTRRELQVLQLIADGRSTKEIASVLTVSVKTIETHRKQIMDKLDIRSTAGLTKYCIREGLTSL
jgi:DNA-binding NarL/FixJ family response regulator